MAVAVERSHTGDENLLGLVRQMYTEAKREKRKYLGSWSRWYRMLRNRTWADNRPSWLPSPQSSEIFPTLHTLVAWMTDQRPRLFTSPDPDLGAFRVPPNQELIAKKATELQQTIESWWITSGQTDQIQMALWDMFTYGAGILKTGYDPIKDEITQNRVDPYAILPDPSASSFDDCRYVLEVRRVPLFEVRARFPERGHLISGDEQEPEAEDSRPKAYGPGSPQVVAMANPGSTGVTGTFPGTSTPGIPPRYGPPGASDDDYTRSVLLKECWIRESERMTVPVIEDGERIDDIEVDAPMWRLVCEAEGVILNPDTANPFDHGKLPYVRMPLVEIGEFWSVPLMEHLGPAQIALNRLLAAAQINAELLGNPILLEDKDSGIDRTKIINRPGGRLSVNAGRKVEWLQPPTMPPAVQQLVGFWRDTIDRISGISAVARGSNLRRREPAQAVDAVQEASFVRIRAAISNMEEALRRSANLLAANIVQYYIDPRAIPMIGPQGAENYLQLGPKHFFMPDVDPASNTFEDIPLHFDVWIEAGSSLPVSRQARTAEAQTLFFAGALPVEELLKAYAWPNWQQVAAQIKQEHAQQAAQGGGPGAGRKNPRRKPQ